MSLDRCNTAGSRCFASYYLYSYTNNTYVNTHCEKITCGSQCYIDTMDCLVLVQTLSHLETRIPKTSIYNVNSCLFRKKEKEENSKVLKVLPCWIGSAGANKT